MRSDMDITRKSFLSAATYGLAGLALFPAKAAATLRDGPGGGVLVDLRRAVGETFFAQGAGGLRVPLVLERAVDVRSDTTVEQFSLYFAADERFSLKEGTWRLVSSDGRRVYDVFLVPAGTNPAGDGLYRADFCLLRGSELPAVRR